MPTHLAAEGDKQNKRKSGSHSKQKGANFERKICVRLSVWASSGTREDLFWRSAMSGGRATLQSRKGRGRKVTKQAGDISAIHPLGHFFLDLFQVECKFLKCLDMDKLAHGLEGRMKQIWYPTLHQAQPHGREPFVICRENRREEIVLTTARGVELLAKSSGARCKPHSAFYRHGTFVFSFRDFLIDCDPQYLRSVVGDQEALPAKPSPRTRRRVPPALPSPRTRRRVPPALPGASRADAKNVQKRITRRLVPA